MTAISSSGALPSVAQPSTVNPISRALVAAPSSGASASTAVRLGQNALASGASTYTQSGSLTDPVWVAMSSKVLSLGGGNPFSDVGAALLSRFSTDGGNYTQFVPAGRTEAGAQAVSNSAMPPGALADNTVSLRIGTASGAQVEVSLRRGTEGMAVQIDVTNGALSEDERNAIASLAGGFQDALDGLAQVPPRLAIAGLADMDTSLLSSVNLRASTRTNGVEVQSIEFSADAGQRSVTVSGPSGEVKVGVDLTKPATFGSAEQQAAAVSRYLQQFDSARSRGQGDETLMSIFKDAFSAVHGSYGAAQAQRAQPAGTVERIPASQAHRSLLSGLADFSASIKQTSKSVNPGRRDEVDGFAFQVSQNSKVSGQARWNLAVSQDQQTSLKASFHKSLSPQVALALTEDKASQNYLYYQVNDATSTRTDLAYDHGTLASASMSQSRNLSMQVSKYVQGKLVEHTVTPTVDSFKRDLLPMFQAAKLDEPDKNSLEPRDQAEASLRRRYLDLARSVAELSQG
ncbi:hypothetical protein [Achromobacter pestifer]|uniref:Lactate dehydrogenase n=1 Tax=Achromobacter pestifer TaxID=1353889 RepID=A0A6S6Z159_9BURK|nr:hypothetical protein [Achromobacter pestifer]CAB3655099.1 hypothetical protein LMG3431_03057 [Achromobacter pestifer]